MLRSLALLLLTFICSLSARADEAVSLPEPDKLPDSELTIKRIFGDDEFETKSFGPYEWLDDGDAYTTVEEIEGEGLEQPNASRSQAGGPPCPAQEEESADDDEPPRKSSATIPRREIVPFLSLR